MGHAVTVEEPRSGKDWNEYLQKRKSPERGRHAPLCDRDGLRAAHPRPECLHHRAGFCQNGHDDRPDRGGGQHRPRPDLSLCLETGRAGRGACDGALPRPFLCVGDCLPLRKKNSPASERKQSPEGTESAAAMHCTGYVLLCYAVEREHYHGVLQLLAAALWRGTILPSVMQFALLRTDLGAHSLSPATTSARGTPGA